MISFNKIVNFLINWFNQLLFHTMAYFYVIYMYVFSECRSIRPVEINQYDITMVTHDITLGNEVVKDVHCEITMGNDVARYIYCDVTMSNDVTMCTYHSITTIYQHKPYSCVLPRLIKHSFVLVIILYKQDYGGVLLLGRGLLLGTEGYCY